MYLGLVFMLCKKPVGFNSLPIIQYRKLRTKACCHNSDSSIKITDESERMASRHILDERRIMLGRNEPVQ